MRRKTRYVAGTAIGFVAMVAVGSGEHRDATAFADAGQRYAYGEGAGFDLSWYTVDGGGGTSIGGDFVLRGTIGQSDAGDMSGGDFALSGGFWQPAAGCGDCPTDVDGNGQTEAFDLANLLGAWGSCETGTPCACMDANGDGTINAFDLATLLGAWGPCVP